ncbi:hypothetical protein BTHE68_16900 [Burkholderia sp. THE68]|nr:hypothetical protein BTHE68_16900 [Burkholderia sp. THE68]
MRGRLCGNSLPTLHQQFQFQLANVGSSLDQKIGALLEANVHNNGVPTDLTGALGSFNIYAAIAFATFNDTGTEAYVSGIYVYIKDNYTFSSEPDSVSQYLGHWSAKGVIRPSEYCYDSVGKNDEMGGGPVHGRLCFYLPDQIRLSPHRPRLRQTRFARRRLHRRALPARMATGR